ncbi:velvet factor-domain-containing protein [Epithele typhae]|uniref:velvet factor-domain-containing protein n=1 Tax=Epithele typhae TaxID=378194 RepID=UPI002008E39B|nr:velvet factor-domain-containing protein [Epithele typhae]KAH9943236.1 velvet factor-domain-containing protein [Epithele typhae]
MIQKTNPRSGSTQVAPTRQASSDGPESWGHWVGRKHYSLEVVQHPIRARMCGFGDKDRRPLAPAAVAKMIVRREDGTFVDVDEIDCSFFLVTVDLWSADGKHEMNLVLHPTSADRYVPANTPKGKRRGTVTQGSSNQRSSRQSPERSAPTPNTSQYPQPSSTAYSTQGYPFPPQAAPIPESNSFQPVHPYVPPTESGAPSWGYPPSTAPVDRSQTYGPPSLPSIHNINRTTSPVSAEPSAPEYGASAQPAPGAGQDWQIQTPVREEQGGAVDYRTWPQQSAYPAPMDVPAAPSATTAATADPREGAYGTVAASASASAADAYPQQARYSQEPYTPVQPSPTQAQAQAQAQQTQQAQQLDSSMYASASYAQQQHQQAAQTYNQGPSYQEPTPPSTIPPLPRHTYTRTLVGPLASNACRLLDEHRKPAIFFLFQDLSIRTEGTFRLRLRLMNVGAPPAPEPRASGVHTEMSPVLAQTFTDNFVVFSAKRFPGVPDTTTLSITLGNQGQKLPLRNRNGSTKQGRKRRRDGSDGSGDESDEA